MGPGDRDMSDGLINLEELKAVRGKLLAQHGCYLKREPALIFPNGSYQTAEVRAS